MLLLSPVAWRRCSGCQEGCDGCQEAQGDKESAKDNGRHYELWKVKIDHGNGRRDVKRI